MRSLVFAAAVLILLPLVPNVYAGGARNDWSEEYDSVPGAPECWQDGYDDGLDRPFDGDRYQECETDIGNPYKDAFLHGCRDAGNTEETCERNID